MFQFCSINKLQAVKRATLKTIFSKQKQLLLKAQSRVGSYREQVILARDISQSAPAKNKINTRHLCKIFHFETGDNIRDVLKIYNINHMYQQYQYGSVHCTRPLVNRCCLTRLHIRQDTHHGRLDETAYTPQLTHCTLNSKQHTRQDREHMVRTKLYMVYTRHTIGIIRHTWCTPGHTRCMPSHTRYTTGHTICMPRHTWYTPSHICHTSNYTCCTRENARHTADDLPYHRHTQHTTDTAKGTHTYT